MNDMELKEMKDFLSKQNSDYKKLKGWLHPIATDSIRPYVIKFLFTCLDKDIPEDACKKILSDIYYKENENECEKNNQNEKNVFEDIILFAYRTLIAYKEHLNAEKNEKDNLTDNSPCVGAE